MQVLSSFHSATTVAASASGPRPRSEQPAPVPAEATHDCKSAVCAKYKKSEHTALFIETQEGDVVRLDFRARDSAQLRASQGTDGSEIRFRAESSTKLAVDVRGDLNAEEMEAIQATIAQAADLADDFFDGDVAAAFGAAAELDIDGDQLARVKLNMRSVERLTYTSRGRGQIPKPEQAPAGGMQVLDEAPVQSEPEPTVTATPMALATEPVSATDFVPKSTVKTPPTLMDGVGTGHDGASRTESAVEPSSSEAPEPIDMEPVRTRHDAFRSIGEFLDRLMDAFTVEGETTGALEMSLKLRIFETTIVTMSEARPQPEPLPAVVHETIDALALHTQAPIDQVA